MNGGGYIKRHVFILLTLHSQKFLHFFILNELERSEIKHSFKIILYFIQATSFYGKVDGMEGLDWVL